MNVREIVQTCSNPHVAHAAVASIGGDFARRFFQDAESRSLHSGLLAARLVQDFERRAGEGDWRGLDRAIHGAEMPVLCGLRHILERAPKLKGGDAPGRRAGGARKTVWVEARRHCA
jgi:hypothetical protein